MGFSLIIYKPTQRIWFWFNKLEKMYHMNNMVVVDHCELFIYLDLGYSNHSMILTSCTNQTFETQKIVFVFCIQMSNLSTCWTTLAIWKKRYLWCEGISCRLKLMCMQLRHTTKCMHDLGLGWNMALEDFNVNG
jgi:hypothetical protein